MKLRILLFIILGIFYSCGHQPEANSNIKKLENLESETEKNDELEKKGIFNRSLKVSQTNEKVLTNEMVLPNSVENTKSLEVNLKFNSKNFKKLKVLRSQIAYECSSQDFIEEYTLVNETSDEVLIINPDSKVATYELEPESSYVFRVVVSTKYFVHCQSFEYVTSLWLGQESEEPEQTLSCKMTYRDELDNQVSKTLVYLNSINPINFYLDNEVFLSDNNFCGKKEKYDSFQDKVTYQSQNQTRYLVSAKKSLASDEYFAEFTLDNQGGGELNCLENDTEYFHGELKGCDQVIIDKKSLQ
ncbi:MAG: hypothetical protein H6621_12440 [Halobacteriovoraceae bacterium]|nr:hypothetical protein [Halobacteriovoraceae bacterium]